MNHYFTPFNNCIISRVLFSNVYNLCCPLPLVLCDDGFGEARGGQPASTVAFRWTTRTWMQEVAVPPRVGDSMRSLLLVSCDGGMARGRDQRWLGDSGWKSWLMKLFAAMKAASLRETDRVTENLKVTFHLIHLEDIKVWASNNQLAVSI